jgi:hypothetical protein
MTRTVTFSYAGIVRISGRLCFAVHFVKVYVSGVSTDNLVLYTLQLVQSLSRLQWLTNNLSVLHLVTFYLFLCSRFVYYIYYIFRGLEQVISAGNWPISEHCFIYHGMPRQLLYPAH